MAETPFDRQALIAWWDQNKISAARVLVIGAGALGNEVIKNLALIGTGQIVVADYDRVEDSNLSRAVFFSRKDARDNAAKALVTAERAQKLNPNENASVKGFHLDVVWELGAGVYRRADVVLGCLDNIEARLSVNKRCWQTRKTWVDGGMWEFTGSVSVFDSSTDKACYECSMTPDKYFQAKERYSCTSARKSKLKQDYTATTQTTSALVAALQTQEAIKLLHHLDSFAGSRAEFFGQTHCYTDPEHSPLSMTRLVKNPQCWGHMEVRYDEVVELPDAHVASTTIAELFEMSKQLTGKDWAMLEFDREFLETVTCPFCGETKTIDRPVRAITDEIIICSNCEVPCPLCGTINKGVPNCVNCGQGDLIQPDMNKFYAIDKEAETYQRYRHYTPAKLGIPPLDILTLRDSHGNTCFIEITGDRSLFWK